MRAKQVGNLAGVKIIRGENDWKWYYLNEVSIRACPFEISRNRQQGSQRCQKTIGTLRYNDADVTKADRK